MPHDLPPDHAPLRGLLAVRLINVAGRPAGSIMVTDKADGADFTEEDELLLGQLAAIASLVMQHIEARTAAEQASRAKDHFLAVLSHELRTPLTPVVMGVSMLQDRADLAPATRETLEMVRRNIEMEARLIDDLLDVTRIERGKIELQKQPVELCTVIHRAVEVCKADIEARGLLFGVDLGPAAPYWVEADVPRLQQVFWNLLKNAIKFTPHGGCVGIRCQPTPKRRL
jgi:two-component system CheB/CheR fusion protein